MVSKLRARITYANVVASLALFIALGGSAYAVTQIDPNSVGTKQLKQGAVKTGKIADGTIKRVDAKAGAFATPPQLAGKLGIGATAANSAKLGNIGPGGFLKGTGNAVTAEFDVTAETNVLDLPGGGHVTVACNASGQAVVFTSTGDNWNMFQYSYVDDEAQPNVVFDSRNANEVVPFSASKQEAAHQIDAKSSSGLAAALTVFIRYADDTDQCIGRVRGMTFPNG